MLLTAMSNTENSAPRVQCIRRVSRLLDEEIKKEMNQVIMRPKKPPRPKSEVFLDREDGPRRKRLSAFGGDSPYGRLDAYIKLEQLGEGSYATVFKGFSNLTKQVRQK